MWFSHAQIYRFQSLSMEELAESMIEHRLKPCPPHSRFIFGWNPALGQDLIYQTHELALISMGKEERLLPKGAIQYLLSDKIQAIETQEGQKIKRALKKQMAEDLEFELLPKAFILEKKTFALIDNLNQRLIINAANPQTAHQLVALLRATSSTLKIEPLGTSENLAKVFANWIMNPHLLPDGFSLGEDCVLFSLENHAKRFSCKGYELPAEEITQILAQGLAVAEISINWRDRIQFTLTQELSLKRIKCLDYLADEIKAEQAQDSNQDAALLLLNAELRALISDLELAFEIPKASINQKQEPSLVEEAHS